MKLNLVLGGLALSLVLGGMWPNIAIHATDEDLASEEMTDGSEEQTPENPEGNGDTETDPDNSEDSDNSGESKDPDATDESETKPSTPSQPPVNGDNMSGAGANADDGYGHDYGYGQSTSETDAQKPSATPAGSTSHATTPGNVASADDGSDAILSESTESAIEQPADAVIDVPKTGETSATEGPNFLALGLTLIAGITIAAAGLAAWLMNRSAKDEPKA